MLQGNWSGGLAGPEEEQGSCSLPEGTRCALLPRPGLQESSTAMSSHASEHAWTRDGGMKILMLKLH